MDSERGRTPQLNYAAPVPWHRRRRGRVLAVGLAAALLVFVGDRYGPGVWNRAEVLYWQRECLTHPDRPDRVVWEPSTQTRYYPACWRRFHALAAPAFPVRPRTAVVFLGERWTRAGKRVLVVCTDESHPSCVILVEPATWLHPAKFSRPTEVEVGMGWGPKSFNPTRVLAGQRHATDPTRFLLTAEERGTRRVVEAWLNDDGSAVYFEIREGAVP